MVLDSHINVIKYDFAPLKGVVHYAESVMSGLYKVGIKKM